MNLLNIGILLLIAASTLNAQTHFKLLFKGVAYQTNSAGKIYTRPITQQTWLIDFAREHSLTNTRNLAVTYHINADEKGDQIEVINTRTGEVYGNIFGFFFAEAFERTGLTNAAGTQTQTLQYLYTGQDSHSLGAAVVIKTQPGGTLRYPKMQGQMHYELLPTVHRKSVQICTGTFLTAQPYK